MTTQTTTNDVLLSLWALEQNFYHNEIEHEPVMCLFSGGQDSSTLAWFLYHTEAVRPNGRSLAHYAHLLQPDNVFMAQHAVNLSFWLGWHHTSILTTQALRSEKEASYWRASLQCRVGASAAIELSVNGHTETDKREADFFKFMRAVEGTDMHSAGLQAKNELNKNNMFALSYTGTFYRSGQRHDAHPLRRGAAGLGFGAPAGDVTSVVTPTSNTSTPESVHRPLMLLTRNDTRLLVASQRLPVYPDQTNFECITTRAQIRYLVFPLLVKLGFTFFE